MSLTDSQTAYTQFKQALDSSSLAYLEVGKPPQSGGVYAMPMTIQYTESGYLAKVGIQLILAAKNTLDPTAKLWELGGELLDVIHASRYLLRGPLELTLWEDMAYTGLDEQYWVLQGEIFER